MFQDVMEVLRRHYECSPVRFCTGAGSARETWNEAGTNSASCFLLSFAKRLGLDEAATVALYGEHYRGVLAEPAGTNHANIRAFMAGGWAGVRFEGDALRLRGPA